jgi:cation:H+ antiporter
MIEIYILVLIVSVFFLIISSKWLIKSLTIIAQFLGWREFVFALFLMAFAGNLPNLFVGISSILQGVAHLSLGEILGGNIVDLTIAAALAAIISKNGLTVQSRTVQGTVIFVFIIALLPLFLIHDFYLSRFDGLILIFSFFIYLFWLFSKEERFARVFDENKNNIELKSVLKNFAVLIGAFVLLLLAAEGVVRSSIFFAEISGLPLILIGILIIGAGNALPEIFFSIQAARRGDDWMVIGALMGAVISAAALTLGIIALLSPIHITASDFSLLTITRIFLIIAAIFFLLFIRSGHRITRKEGLVLLIIYLSFVVAQVLAARS